MYKKIFSIFTGMQNVLHPAVHCALLSAWFVFLCYELNLPCSQLRRSLSSVCGGVLNEPDFEPEREPPVNTLSVFSNHGHDSRDLVLVVKARTE